MSGHSTAQIQTAAAGAKSLAQAPVLQRACDCGQHTHGAGECPACHDKGAGVLQRAASGPAPAMAPPVVHEVLNSPGQPLDAATRALMEPRFGRDFSRVRLHVDTTAADSARAVNARAYTVGRDVVFGAGQYQPTTNEGRKLMAHELSHVVQQERGGASPQPLFGSMLEQEAGAAAASFIAERGPIRVARASAPMLARQPLSGGLLLSVNEPRSLKESLLTKDFTETDLMREIEAIQEWLVVHPLDPRSDDLRSKLIDLQLDRSGKAKVRSELPELAVMDDYIKAGTYLTDFYDNEDKIVNDVYLHASNAVHKFGLYMSSTEEKPAGLPMELIKAVLRRIPGAEETLEVIEMVERGVSISKEVAELVPKSAKITDVKEKTAEALGEAIAPFTEQRESLSQQRKSDREYLDRLHIGWSYRGLLLETIQARLGPIRPYNAKVIAKFEDEYELQLYKDYCLKSVSLQHTTPYFYGSGYAEYLGGAGSAPVPERAGKRIVNLFFQLGYTPNYALVDPRVNWDETDRYDLTMIELVWGVRNKWMEY